MSKKVEVANKMHEKLMEQKSGVEPLYTMPNDKPVTKQDLVESFLQMRKIRKRGPYGTIS